MRLDAIALVLALGASPGTPKALLAEANRIYRSAANEEGDARRSLYLEAARLYTQLAREVPNGYTFYNLGNAYYRAGQFGRAIAAYRRAQELLPRNSSIRINIELARERAAGGTSAPRPHPAAAAFFFWHYALSLAEVEALAAVFYLGALATLAAAGFVRQQSQRRRVVGVAAALGALALVAVLSACVKLAWGVRDHAVVVAAEARARSDPAGRSPELFVVREGAELHVLARTGDWTRIESGRDARGWVETRALEFLSEPPGYSQ